MYISKGMKAAFTSAQGTMPFLQQITIFTQANISSNTFLINQQKSITAKLNKIRVTSCQHDVDAPNKMF